MPKTVEGKIVAKGMRFGVIASRFNDFICGRLIEGALDALVRAGADEKDIQVYKVPGAFELPLAAKKIAKSGRFDAVICLGAVIRGATPHFEYISAEVTRELPWSAWKRKCLSPSGSSRPIRSNRPSSAPGRSRATRAGMRP